MLVIASVDKAAAVGSAAACQISAQCLIDHGLRLSRDLPQVHFTVKAPDIDLINAFCA